MTTPLLAPANPWPPQANTVYNVDALTLLRSMPDASVDLLLTDIPYNEINDNERLHERAKFANGPIRNLYKGMADVMTVNLNRLLEEVDRVTRGFIYIFCGTKQAGDIRAYFSDRDCLTRHCVWEKTNPTPMMGEYIWLSSVENCIVARKRGAKFNQFCKSAVWRFQSGTSKAHPTQKPTPLFRYLIESSSQYGDLVVDPFAGSGTTAVAAFQCGRRFIAGDTDAGYVDIARRRLQTTTPDMFAAAS